MQTINTTYGSLSSPTTLWTGSVNVNALRIRAACISCCSQGTRVAIQANFSTTTGFVSAGSPITYTVISASYHYDDYDDCRCLFPDFGVCKYNILTSIRLSGSTTVCDSSDPVDIKISIIAYNGGTNNQFDCNGSAIDLV